MSNAKAKCEWEMDEDGNGSYYQTACGQAFVFEADSLKENSFVYCPFCGKTINEAKQVTPEEE